MLSTELGRDLNSIKPKILGGMDKKQIIFFLISLFVAVITFNLTGLVVDNINIKIITLVIFTLPFVAMGFLQNGEISGERQIYLYLKRKFDSPKRYYKEENF